MKAAGPEQNKVSSTATSATRSRGKGTKKKDGASLRRLTEQGERFPYYLLHGSEGFERDSMYSWLSVQLEPEAARDFNVDVFHGDSLDPQRVLDAYFAYPVMTSHRLIILKSCEKLAVDKCRALEPLVKSPVDTCVVLAVGEKVDLRRSLFRSFSQSGYGVEFKPPYDNQLPEWIARQGERSGIALEPEAVEVLRLYVGGNLRELASEIEKLAVFTNASADDSSPRRAVSRQAVEEHVGLSRQTNIFALTDAIGEGDRRLAIELTHALIDLGEEPIRIVAMLSRHLQILLRAKDFERLRLAAPEMAKRLGVAPYFLSGYRNQARAQSVPTLWRGLSRVLAADSRIKSSGRPQQRTILDICVGEITGGPAGGGAGQG